MCQENDSAASRQQLEARCFWCGIGILTVRDVSSDGEHPPAAGFVASQINCSHCNAQVSVGVGKERAMLPFVTLMQLLDSLRDLEMHCSTVQSVLSALEQLRQAGQGKG